MAARADTPSKMTQRRINSMAAKTEQALSVILEIPNLRLPNESVRDYCSRLAAKRSDEVATDYAKRLNGYADHLAQAVPLGMTDGKLPALADTSAVNLSRWQRLTRTFAYLPKRLSKFRAAIAAHKPTAGELEQTLALLAAARNDLRDARP